jgi:hypothetical protein
VQRGIKDALGNARHLRRGEWLLTLIAFDWLSNEPLKAVSLLFKENSLFRPRQFPVRALKFPVRLGREFRQKLQRKLGFFVREVPLRRQGSQKFPVFSLMIREFGRRERFASDCVIRHAVPISPLAVPAITKKGAFAGQYRDLRAPEIAIEIACSG